MSFEPCRSCRAVLLHLFVEGNILQLLPCARNHRARKKVLAAAPAFRAPLHLQMQPFSHTLTAKSAADVPLRKASDALPYVAQFNWKNPAVVGRWRERLAGICAACFENASPCCHFPELPLRCLILGNNPSDDAFATGYNYANPTNRFMLLLKGALGEEALHFSGLFPRDAEFPYQNICAIDRGVGLTDLSPIPGNDLSAFFEKNGALPQSWREDCFRACEGHMRRVSLTLEYLLDRANRVHQMVDTGSKVGEKRARAKSALQSADAAAAPSGAGSVYGKEEEEEEEEGCDVARGAATEGAISPQDARSALDVFSELAGWMPPLKPDALPVEASASSSSSVASPSATSAAGQASTASTVSRITTEEQCRDPRYTSPRIVACTGKTQWSSLFSPPLKRCDHGLQPQELRPKGWPFPPSTQVFVLASSSGRAALSNEQRSAPYRELAALVATMPWVKQPTSAAEAIAALSKGDPPAGSMKARRDPSGGSAKKARRDPLEDEALTVPEEVTVVASEATAGAAGAAAGGAPVRTKSSRLARELIKVAPGYRAGQRKPAESR